MSERELAHLLGGICLGVQGMLALLLAMDVYEWHLRKRKRKRYFD